MKDEHMKDAVQGAAEDVTKDVAQDLAFGAWAARAFLATPPPPPPYLCAVRAEMGAQLGSSVAFGSGCGQALPGVPRKAPLVDLPSLPTPSTGAPSACSSHMGVISAVSCVCCTTRGTGN